VEQWHSQEFSIGIGGLGSEPPAAADGKEFWGEPPALGDFFLQFFNKNNAFYAYKIFRSK